MADNCLRVFVVLELARAGAAERESAWHLVTALLMLPAVVLAPLNGALGNSLPKRRVLAGAALYCCCVVALFGLLAEPSWVLCWALVAVGAAVYSPTRYALLPAAAEETHIPLTRVNGWIETGALAAVVGGLILGGFLHESTWPELSDSLGGGPGLAAWAERLHHYGLPPAVAAALALNLLGLLAALPASFRTDVRRPESPGQALTGFFRDCRRILKDREAGGCLVALACFRGLVTAMTGALIATLGPGGAGGEGIAFEDLLRVGLWVLAGLAAGSLLAGVQGHPVRSLGLVPIGAAGLVVGLIIAAVGAVPSPGLCLVLGVLGGLVNVPLAAAYQARLPADARGNGMAVRNTTDYVMTALLSGLLFGLSRLQILGPAGQLWLVALLAAAGAAVGWRVLFRDVLELVTEWLIWPMYRIRARGPGLEHFPRRGPLLVVANHSAWFDPMWLAKVLPRRLTPMMTSQFYDLPVLRWLMRDVVHAIRVEASTFRREAPEIQEAVAALDRGECVIIFPEGWLRRYEDRPLRNFGQGVWHILRQRPQTPVMVCWTEGGWGSYTSRKGGPPLVNKRPDIRRRIDIGVGEPQTLDPALLADQRATRAYLMQACLDSRRHLGLPPLALDKVREEPDQEGDEKDAPSLEKE
jgi:1-acyl-sn-glycerol-3-phosphate acyltransferase